LKFRSENIAYIFQSFNLIDELTAKKIFIFHLIFCKKKLDDNDFNKVLEHLGISDRLEHFPKELSGGQQQRVAIARAILSDAQIILCDEPTGNLDSKSGEEVMSLLKNLNHEYDKTVIIVTHDSNIASQADAIVRIEDGRISLER
jgi:putative ABC transport system ATP-binding protein